jgi:murein DD-endopeptidase MepM/ murein hydrolase activator NlpD
MIVPERSSNVRKWMISDKTIKTALVSAVVLGVFLITSTLFTVQYFRKTALFEATRLENNYLESKLAQLQDEVNVADTTLVRVRNFEQKLRVLTQADTQTTTNIGPITDEDQQIFQNQGLNTVSSSPRVAALHSYQNHQQLEINVERVKKKASLQEQSLQELYELLKDQKSVLASTPSVRPVDGYFTSGFGYRISPFTGKRSMHAGIDLFAPTGTPVKASADGVVTRVTNDAGYGKFVVISHGYGFSTLYAHNSKLHVKVGQKVKRGQLISEVGSTGRSTGPHLHYEVKLNGKAVNPVQYILN